MIIFGTMCFLVGLVFGGATVLFVVVVKAIDREIC